MPKDKDLKRLVRARMAKTGESYTTARVHIIDKKNRNQASGPDDAEPITASAGQQRTTAEPPGTPEDRASLPIPDDYEKIAGKSDAAVKKASGRTWPEWVALLDRHGAASMEHRAIAKLVHETYDVGQWWAQTITVGYERLRGLRDVGQRRGGSYEASKSVTVAAPVEALRRALYDPEQRKRWLPDVELEIRTATEAKSMRIRLADGIRMEVYFTAKGPAKSALAVQLQGFPDKEAAQAAKEFWGERLAALKALVAPE
ncbi:MAG TPA: hypothetical protein VF192_03145 [Longimicrobiales bacterium]